MSVMFESEDGWIISHLDYLHSIYQSVEDGQNLVKLVFNDKFFKVNSQYLRQNQVDKCISNTNGTSTHIEAAKRKRKNTSTLPLDILEQNDFVKETSEKLLKAATIKIKLFTDIITQDNNEESRSESNKFYSSALNPACCNYRGRNDRTRAIVINFLDNKYVFPSNCRFICNDVRQMSEMMDSIGDYDLILMDPPWWNKSIRRKKVKCEESSYKMLYNKELSEIPIKRLLNATTIVAVWCTNASSIEKSILEDIFPTWGLVFKAKWFWLKITQNGYPVCEFNDSHGKQPYEQIIFGTLAANKEIDFPDKKILISIPSSVHSHKPPLTEILKPYLPMNPKCMEIFARYLLPGWTSWGLEVLKFQHSSLFSSVQADRKE